MIYKSAEGQNILNEHYHDYLDLLGVPVEREYIQTTYGKTHILLAGPKEGKPLFVLQGGNCINPMTLSWFTSLAGTYRIYAPDTIGHPGFSEQRRLNAKDETFAKWIAEMMDHYQLDKASFIGPSYGGGIILRLATFLPQRIDTAVLVCPAGLQLGSKWKMIKNILVPMMMFTTFGSKPHLDTLADAMSSGVMKQVDRTIIGDIFKNVKLEQEMPKQTTKEELEHYQAPTLVIAGKDDVFFPSAKLKHAVNRVFSSPVTFTEYPMGHFPSTEQLNEIGEEIRKFLAENEK